MNKNGFIYGVSEKCFRPQQGVTYYEYLSDLLSDETIEVSVPNRGLPIMN